jgi:hypothetical protein
MMNIDEIKKLVKDYGDGATIKHARRMGFRGQTHYGATRFILMHWLPTVRPVWERAPIALGRIETREQYRARHRIQRMTKRHRDEISGRILRTTDLPHTIKEVKNIVICDEARVVKHKAYRVPAEREGGCFSRITERGFRVPAKLSLHFPYRAIKLPFVGRIVDDAIIMDAEPIEDGYRVLYTRNAAGANVVMRTGYWFGDALAKTDNESKARAIALIRTLGGGQ